MKNTNIDKQVNFSLLKKYNVQYLCVAEALEIFHIYRDSKQICGSDCM